MLYSYRKARTFVRSIVKLKEADKWLPLNATELAAEKFNMHPQHIQVIRWGGKVNGKIRWNTEVVLFLLKLAKERKDEAQALLETDFS